MAVLKHIASKNADYGEAINYLLFQHNEENGKPILDEQGRMVLREEFYMDGINCEAMSFDQECEQVNDRFHKNKKYQEIKSHHYIISFDPRDVADHGLTGEQAHALCLKYANDCFPGHQALVVTHTDGHNASGNIHTHIVINSVRKEDVKEQAFMERPCDHKAGYKHHLTKDYLKFLEQSVIEMCEEKGLHQVDLLNPAPVKITQKEYWAKRRGQKRLDKINEEIIADGLNPRTTTFQTQKELLRNAIDDIAKIAKNWDEFENLLFEKYEITVRNRRGRIGYGLNNREKHISGRALGINYGYNYLSEHFERNLLKASRTETDYRKNRYVIFRFKSELQLVVDLQKCVKSQNPDYAQKVKISNLQHMADTLIYVQDHNYDNRSQIKHELLSIQEQLDSEQKKLSMLQAKLANINEQIRYNGQFFSNKNIYKQMLESPNKGLFHKEHTAEINAYEEARQYRAQMYPDKKAPTTSELNHRKQQLKELIQQQKQLIQEISYHEKELHIAADNVDAILDMQPLREQPKLHEVELS